MSTVDWYFDFISPYSYLAWHRLKELPAGTVVNLRPVLFAGLLKAWDQKGPAEVPAKRQWTYRWCTWLAQQQGIPFRFPAVHPFNPLPYLRMSIAASDRESAVERIFAALWTGAGDPRDRNIVATLLRELQLEAEHLEEPAIKETLRAETRQAVQRGVFGVPTLVIDDEVFWGVDGMDFAIAYLQNPRALDNPEMRRVTELPEGVPRRES